ncbi:MAG: hypothetical protein RMJ98_00220 [Myxococcales bacterium]|nr:hypothetical protein [Myxococcales bacterium]
MVCASAAVAQERPTLAGTWNASPLTEAWNLGDWGEACGPRPTPRGVGGGVVAIAESGGELTFSGGSYPRTNGCYEMGGGIYVLSHSASPRGWRTTCGTAPGDPRRATIITTITATDRLISFDETGQYQFLIQGQNCTASVRRSRTYTLIRRQGEEVPPTATSVVPPATSIGKTAPEAPKAEARPAPSCDHPGEPARIELRPGRKVLKPGETFSAKALLLDEAGCQLGGTLAWSVQPVGAGVTVGPTGLISVAQGAREGEVTVLAGVSGKAARMIVEVVSPERYAQLLAAGTERRGEDEVAVAVLAAGSVGSSEAVGQDDSGKRRMMFAGVVGGVVMVLVGVGVGMMKRTRPEEELVEELVRTEPTQQVVRKKRVVVKVAASAALYCPFCKRGYSPGPAFCPEDGTKLEANPNWKHPGAGP